MEQKIIDHLLSEEPGQAVLNALNEFVLKDRYLLDVDANERSLTHRTAIYLQNELPGWDVDCEYNRDDHEPKEIVLYGGEPNSSDTNAQTVYPDIIVHQRGTTNNYLVIEFKKTTSTIGPKKDMEKLYAFRKQFGYKFALFVELETRHVNGGVANVKWVGA